MPLFEYKCTECGLVDEHLILSGRAVPETQACTRCRQTSVKKPSTFALARSAMDNAPTDNFIGKDAEQRWNDIHRRQEARDKVRTETGVAGLTMTGRNDFAPLTETQKELRTSMHEAVASGGGFKPVEPVPGS